MLLAYVVGLRLVQRGGNQADPIAILVQKQRQSPMRRLARPGTSNNSSVEPESERLGNVELPVLAQSWARSSDNI